MLMLLDNSSIFIPFFPFAATTEGNTDVNKSVCRGFSFISEQITAADLYSKAYVYIDIVCSFV